MRTLCILVIVTYLVTMVVIITDMSPQAARTLLRTRPSISCRPGSSPSARMPRPLLTPPTARPHSPPGGSDVWVGMEGPMYGWAWRVRCMGRHGGSDVWVGRHAQQENVCSHVRRHVSGHVRARVRAAGRHARMCARMFGGSKAPESAITI